MSAAPGDTIEVSVWRGKDAGRYQIFTVPLQASQTVLDIVTWIQRNADPTLAYRFACRVGVCGSCAMTVNGVPRWTCRTHVAKVTGSGKLEIGPLANLPSSRISPPTWRRSSRSGSGRMAASCRRRRAPMHWPSSARKVRNAARPARPSSASTAACATPPAIPCAGTMATWVQPHSTARGPSSTTCAMPAIPRALLRWLPTAAATTAIRISPASSSARQHSIRLPRSPASSGAPCRPTSGGELQP